jgi:hypothetical protein
MSKLRNTKLNFLIIIILLLASLPSKVYSAVASLRDVPQGHWARGSVKTLVEDYGFMQGDPNGNFGGSRALSRYEFAKTMTNMLDYLKKQMDADHKDLEGLVSVMEMFQSEIKSLEAKLASANSEVTKQNATVSELNELVVALGDEYNTLKANPGQPSADTSATVPESFEQRLTQVEEKVDSLKNRGLFVDTLLRGTLNDVRNVTMGTGKMFKSAKEKIKTPQTQSETSAETKAETTVKEEVRADINKAPEKESSTAQPELPVLAPVTEPIKAPSSEPAVHSHADHTSTKADPVHDFYSDNEEDVDEEDLGDIDSFYD